MSSLIESLRLKEGINSSIAMFVIVAHFMLVTSPTAAAVNNELDKEQQQTEQQQQSAEAAMSEAFAQAVEKLALLKQLRKEDKETDAVIGELNDLKTNITELDAQVLENFARVGADLKQKKLAKKIRQRHTKMVKHYKTQRDEFMDLLKAATDTGIVANMTRGINNLIGNLTKTQAVTPDEAAGNTITEGNKTWRTKDFRRGHQEFDPNNLPTKAIGPEKTPKPKVTQEDYIQSGLRNSPQLHVASLGDFSYDKLEEATNPAYLAATDEVLLSDSIKAKAEELEYDAVKIYHWVRNNIEWLPSWGAIQDAELTLEAQRGNAMDIASLTIALLRTSQIPARYVHGTIDVPVEHYKNWAGGFTSEEAASNYAASNGIPTTGIISGGRVNTIRMEHVWVEAATDFHPSRGAKNREADTWVQLDPSYKQYEYLEEIDVIESSGLDIEKIAKDIYESGNYNETDNSISGIDSSVFDQNHEGVVGNLNDYISDNIQNPTVKTITGEKKTIIKEYPALPSSIPNRIVTIGARYDKLSSALQQHIEFSFGKDILGESIDPTSFAWSTLNNEKVTLLFKTATEADEQALKSLIPEGVTELSQLPNSIPSYLINVLPEIHVNGEVVKTGNLMKLGEELKLVTGIKFAGRGYLQSPRSYDVVAGSYLNLNVFAGSVSPVKLDEAKNSILNTKKVLEELEANGQENIGSLTHNEILGDLYYSGGLSYYSQLLGMSEGSGLKSGAFMQLSAGYGTFGYEPRVNSFFGVPRGINSGGAVFDIPFIQVTAVKDGSETDKKNFTLQTGFIASSLEHMVPEQMFQTEENNLKAVSAVRAIHIANQQGQKIFTINKDNQTNILPQLSHSSEVMDEIRQALTLGKEITTHESPVSISGWSGTGYIILDPSTGAGGYLISGGQNGGFIALGYIIQTLTLFYNALEALAGTVAKGVPTPLGSVARMLTVAKFMFDVLKKGADCGGGAVGDVIFVMMLFTLVSLVMGQIVLLYVNPLAGFAAGVALDAAANWLIGKAQNCS